MSTTSKSASTAAPQSPDDDGAAAETTRREESHSSSTFASSTSSLPPNKTLEGTLLYRYRGGQATVFKTKMLKQTMRMYAVFDLSDRVGLDFGALRCYRFVGLTKKESNAAYSSTRLARRGSDCVEDSDLAKKKQLCLEFPASLPWMVRDVENDTTAFIVEVSTSGYSEGDEWDGFGDDAATVTTYGTDGGRSGSGSGVLDQSDADIVNTTEGDDEDDEDDDDLEDDEDGVFNFWGDSDDEDAGSAGSAKEGGAKKPNQVRLDLARAAARNEPFVKYSFRCPHKKNEKALWLTAFGKVGRLSTESNRKKGFFSTASAALAGATAQRNSRVRTSAAAVRAKTRVAMERQMSMSSITQENDQLEYRVRPSYAYPHRWMTNTELTEEMVAPSAVVHDLRLRPQVATRPELGLLRVEVLQCLGLPGPSASNNPNATVYLVCGSYAFSTDVISSCKNPMWLNGVKRACLIPIYHGYARLFAGVFHRDGSKSSSKDAFIGRVEIELARLKPGRTYDTTLPLRLSTSVYSRRKLGAIRVRLTLSKFVTKQILLSYLPSKRNRLAGQVGTTVACGDAKSFHAVALTVHGKHLPGKFSTEALMAIIREFTFVQKSAVRLAKKFAEDLVVWRYPAMSSLAFLGWMHCVRDSSATLAPVYMLGVVVLQLLKNYARCFVGEKDSLRPTSIEEILVALKHGTVKNNTEARPIEAEGGTGDGARGGAVSFLQALGMLKKDEYYVDGVDTYMNSEFPFSSLAGYPLFDVEEATKDSGSGKSELDADSDEEIIADGSGDADGTASSTQNQLQRYPSESDQAAYVPRLNFKAPEQNIDKKNPKSDKTLAEELQEVKEKAHKFTMQLFADNHPYMITDTRTPPWGRRQQKSEKNGEQYDVKRDLDKLLGLGQFSQWNPIVSKFTVQVEPLVGVFEVALCAYRSVYNIFTWRDPFLSFWFSICCILIIVVLLLFPWRTIFFVTGVIALGPQNWIMRLFRELVDSEVETRPVRFLRAFRDLLKSSDGGDKDGEGTKALGQRNVSDDYSPQPVFHHHDPVNKANIERNQTVGAQHVCIPYTPLSYHRFYDWPPDPKYAHVINEMPLDSSTVYASAHDDIVTVRELPITRPKKIDKPSSTNQDSAEEAKDASASIQVPASKIEDVTSSTPSLPSSVISSQPDDVSLDLSQVQVSESSTATAGNAVAGKVWSRAYKAMGKGGQVKETQEKKSTQQREVTFDEDGTKDEEITGTSKHSARAMAMGRRPNINWFKTGKGHKGNNASQNDDQVESSDQGDDNDSVCVGTESKGGSPEPADEEISTLPVDIGSVDDAQDKDVTQPEDGPPSTKDTSETLLQDKEVTTTIVSGEEAQESDEDGANDDEITGARKLSARAMAMGRRPNFNWLKAGLKAETGPKRNSDAHNDGQIESSDQGNDNGSVCVGTESEGGAKSGAPEPTDEEISTLPVDSESGGYAQDKDVAWPEGSSPPTKDTREAILQDEEVMATIVSGEEAGEKPTDTTGPTTQPLSISKNDDCKSNRNSREDTGYSEVDGVEQGGDDVVTIEEGINPIDALNTKDICHEEGEKEADGNTNVEATSATENAVNAPPPRSETDLLLEELMVVKLELANTRSENDQYQRVLKETLEELNTYRSKCAQYEKQTFKKLKAQFGKKK